MKKNIFLYTILMILAMLFLVGCSLEYSSKEKDDDFQYAVAKKKAFVANYLWDGKEESMTVKIPKKYGEKDIVGIGGYYGRGLPMPFEVDISAFQEEDIKAGAQPINERDVEKVDRQVELNFLILYRGELKEGIKANQNHCEYLILNGVVTKYEVYLDIRPKDDADNGITPGINITTAKSDEASAIFEGSNTSELNIYNANSNTLTFLNPDGSLYEQIEISELIPSLFNDFGGIYYARSFDHSVFISSVREDDQGIYEYNIDTKELTKIYSGSMYYPTVSVLDGELYVDDLIYDSETSTNYMSSLRIYRNTNGDWTSEPVYEKLCRICSEEGAFVSRRDSGNPAYFAPGYSLSRYGKIALPVDFGLYIYDESGNLLDTVTNDDENRYVVQGMDSEHIIYILRDKNYQNHGLYVYDLNTKENTCLYTESEGEYIEILDYADACVYACTVTEPGYSKQVYEIKAFSVNDKTVQDIATVESVPGHHYLDYLVSNDFKILGNTAVYSGENENSTGLLCSIRSGDKWIQKDLHIPYAVYDYADYADIESQVYSVLCPYCNKYDAFKYYYEYPVIKSNIPNADKINDFILKEAKGSYNMATDYSVDYTEEDCRSYLHNEYESNNLQRSVITGIDEVLGHYLVIYRDEYEMFIGANHGMYYDRCELFDLDSGENVKFMDIYKGSEEEFKEIVASAAKEQFKTDPELMDRTYATDETEMYRGILEYIRLDWEAFKFYDDYLTVDFDPYMVGSYADGIVSIKVPYSKLGL